MTRDGFFDRLSYLCKVHGKTKEFSPDKLEAMFRYWGGLPYEVWRDAVSELACESVFPSKRQIDEVVHVVRKGGAGVEPPPTLPSLEECCTPEEQAFWLKTFVMAERGKTPREVAEFAATGLDDPMLSRAYPYIREAMRKWARMGDTWADYDHPEQSDDLRAVKLAEQSRYNPVPAAPLTESNLPEME